MEPISGSYGLFCCYNYHMAVFQEFTSFLIGLLAGWSCSIEPACFPVRTGKTDFHLKALLSNSD